MPSLRHLSGNEVISILRSFGFAVHSQRGSHVKLQRITAQGARQVLTIPRHRELDTDTVRAIFRQASRFVAENDLRTHFYSD